MLCCALFLCFRGVCSARVFSFPLSNLTFAEAKEKGEVDVWRASKKETEACADQFDAEFGMAYHERRMPEFLAEMADKYGMDRCKIVLASIIDTSFFTDASYLIDLTIYIIPFFYYLK